MLRIEYRNCWLLILLEMIAMICSGVASIPWVFPIPSLLQLVLQGTVMRVLTRRHSLVCYPQIVFTKAKPRQDRQTSAMTMSNTNGKEHIGSEKRRVCVDLVSVIGSVTLPSLFALTSSIVLSFFFMIIRLDDASTDSTVTVVCRIRRRRK